MERPYVGRDYNIFSKTLFYPTAHLMSQTKSEVLNIAYVRQYHARVGNVSAGIKLNGPPKS